MSLPQGLSIAEQLKTLSITKKLLIGSKELRPQKAFNLRCQECFLVNLGSDWFFKSAEKQKSHRK
ncbi:hypothetical protein [Paenochrobactrum glaciei]|uniref:hypothetical protein n=1 Tax=Paenochrobactrum glaciei TaxID=486407 RepID=UPI0031E22FE1